LDAGGFVVSAVGTVLVLLLAYAVMTAKAAA
jgi:hypothetical protein